MAKAAGRPSWFKLFLHNKATLDAMPDETVGKAIKAAFHYFETGEVIELDPMAFVAFSALKPSVDESFSDFKETSEKNRNNVMKRWKKQSLQDNTSGNELLQGDTKNTEAEAEAEAEAEKKQKKEGVKAAKPPRNRFIPPSVEEVFEYCQTRENRVDPQRFVDYYTSNGWMVGRNKMKDWKAAVHTWERTETTTPQRGQQARRGSGQELLDMINGGYFDE